MAALLCSVVLLLAPSRSQIEGPILTKEGSINEGSFSKGEAISNGLGSRRIALSYPLYFIES